MSHLIVNGVDKTLDHIKIKAIIKGLSEPLCGIGTYKDTLDLSTGVLTRYVKKLVLDGTEDWLYNAQGRFFYIDTLVPDYLRAEGVITSICSHYKSVPQMTSGSELNNGESSLYSGIISLQRFYIKDENYSGITGFANYLTAQYANGTPVMAWYVLATPETEQITVPSGLTGTIEGYLTQTGTPTPSNPIYPTANGEEESGGTYSIGTGEYIEAWEARDKNDHLLWGRADTFTGTNSISARCYGLPVKSWEIDGNSQQSGTPAPDDPIYPDFVGERTANLAPTIGEDSGWRVGYLTNQGTYTNSNPRGEILSPMISLSGIGSFTISASNYSSPSMSVYYFNGATFISNQSATDYGGSVFDNFPSGATQFCFAIRTGYKTIDSVVNRGWRVMLNTGSTAKPYEPYGYKLDITSAGQTVPVYLGQVQTLRRIKKLVLTGDEDGWTDTTVGGNHFFLSPVLSGGAAIYIGALSTHYIPSNASGAQRPDNSIRQIVFLTTYSQLSIRDDACATLTDFKTFLQQQYTNSTPVTVWYVLATPETTITNEPLAKIGTYADTLTSDQAGITIPTVDGSTTISVDTALAPSRFEIKVHAKPI